MPQRLPASVFFALFTVSGFAGLIYESIWSHYLKLFLGHAAYAQTLVLAIFMGGMAIGSWLVSRFTRRIPNLLVGYALAELGIGLAAIAFHRVFLGATGWAFDTVLPRLAGSGVDAFKWGLASALILPASILLGTTFPLMSAGLMRLYRESAGRTLSMLYFTNSFGAALGVLASGFVLIERLGLPGTILTAGLLNVSLALVVWVIARRLPAPAAAEAVTVSPATARLPFTTIVLVLAFATGAASFVYEITWIRMLVMGLGASTHAFEVMLAAFIAAMALGAWWVRERIAPPGRDVAWLAALLVAKALFAVYAIWIYSDILSFVAWMMHAVARTEGGYVLNTIAGLAASMLVMFPTAFCAGMTLPIATHALTARGAGEGSIGRVYAANTAGCILGAAFATHIGMEALGIKGLTGAGALLDIAVALLVFGWAPRGEMRPRALAALAAVAAVGLAGYFATDLDQLRMSSGVYRYGVFNDPADSTVRFYRDGKTATVAVVDIGLARSLRTNGKADASILLVPDSATQVDETTMIVAGALALAVKPEARTVANIGFGSGLTTHTLLGSPAIGHLDTVEIERAIVEASRLFAPRNDRAYSDPRSAIHIEDAKTYFASHGERYDVIVSEPSNPWVSGVSTLFSEEFYGQVKRYMKDDAVLVQWIQAYEIDLNLLSTVFNALGNQFSDYAVYGTYTDLLVVAVPTGRLPPLRADLFGYPRLAAELRQIGIRSLRDLQAMRVGARAVLDPLFRSTGFPANSDFHPVLDQGAARARFLERNSMEILSLRAAPVPALALLDGDFRLPLADLRGTGLARQARSSEAISGAESIGIALTGAADQSHVLAPVGRANALIAHGLLGDCRDAGQEWLRAVTSVAAVATPALERDDVQPFFDRMRGSACARSLDAHGRLRLQLLEAVNRRDAAAIGALAEQLLEDPADAQRSFDLQAAIVARLASGDTARATELANRHLAKIPDAELRSSLQWRLILSLLGQARRGVK